MKDKNLKLCEIFRSISGEGIMQGVLSCFIRFSGCNMDCDYCDTKYHNFDFKWVSVEDILNNCIVMKSKYFVVTGGEPFVQHDDIYELIKKLASKGRVEIETNGTNLYTHVSKLYSQVDPKKIILTVDLKLHKKDSKYFKSFEEGLNLIKYKMVEYSLNYNSLPFCCIKVVVKNKSEIDMAYKFSQKHREFPIIVSPCYNLISPTDIAEYMIEKNYDNLKMQIQLHKFLWEANARGR